MADAPQPEAVQELTPEQEKLVSDHLELVKLIAFYESERFRSFEHDEFVSLGFVGLIEAAQRFDRTKGDDFPKFARMRIRGIIRDAVRRALRHMPAEPSDTDEPPADSHDPNDPESLAPAGGLEQFADPTPSLGTKFYAQQIREILEAVKQDLGPEDQALADALFREELTVRQITERTGLPKSTVHDRAVRLERRLRKAIVERTR